MTPTPVLKGRQGRTLGCWSLRHTYPPLNSIEEDKPVCGGVVHCLSRGQAVNFHWTSMIFGESVSAPGVPCYTFCNVPQCILILDLSMELTFAFRLDRCRTESRVMDVWFVVTPYIYIYMYCPPRTIHVWNSYTRVQLGGLTWGTWCIVWYMHIRNYSIHGCFGPYHIWFRHHFMCFYLCSSIMWHPCSSGQEPVNLLRDALTELKLDATPIC